MAKPPEPIEELLTEASRVVEAEVVRVVSQGEMPERPPHAEGATSVPYKTAEQVVVLKIVRALKGQASGELTVDKPQSDYMLREGNKGAFFLKDAAPNPIIIGRFGPDTYRVDTVERALKSHP